MDIKLSQLELFPEALNDRLEQSRERLSDTNGRLTENMQAIVKPIKDPTVGTCSTARNAPQPQSHPGMGVSLQSAGVPLRS